MLHRRKNKHRRRREDIRSREKRQVEMEMEMEKYEPRKPWYFAVLDYRGIPTTEGYFDDDHYDTLLDAEEVARFSAHTIWLGGGFSESAEDHIETTFSQFGEILAIKTSLTEDSLDNCDSASKFSLVTFRDPADALAAAAFKPGLAKRFTVNDEVVQKAMSDYGCCKKGHTIMHWAGAQFEWLVLQRTVLVQGLHPNHLFEKDLFCAFRPYGKIDSLVILPLSSRAVIIFGEEVDATQCIRVISPASYLLVACFSPKIEDSRLMNVNRARAGEHLQPHLDTEFLRRGNTVPVPAAAKL